jgi:hypothetical protein
MEQARVVAHVRMWLGRDRVSADIRVHVHGAPRRPRLLTFEVTRAGVTRQRIFDPRPDNCDEAHAVMGLAIALALDEEHAQQLLRLAQPKAPRVRRLTVQASAAYAALPGVALGGQLGVELAASAWFSTRVDLLTLYAWRRVIPYSQGRFDALLLGGSLEACAGGFLDSQVRLALCTGPAVGAIHAWGRSYAPNFGATGLWLALRSGLRLEFLLGVRWLLDLEVISGIRSPSFAATRRLGAQLERKADAAGFALSLGPALSF